MSKLWYHMSMSEKLQKHKNCKIDVNKDTNEGIIAQKDIDKEVAIPGDTSEDADGSTNIDQDIDALPNYTPKTWIDHRLKDVTGRPKREYYHLHANAFHMKEEDVMDSKGVYPEYLNKHPRWFLRKHPKGRYWNEEEKTYAILALMATNGNIKKALALLRQWKQESNNDDIFIPEDPKAADYALRAIKMHHRNEILQHIISDEVLWQIRELAKKSSNDRVRLEAMKHLWDRAEGKPISKVQQDINVLTYTEIELMHQNNAQRYSHGEWVNPEDVFDDTEDE